MTTEELIAERNRRGDEYAAVVEAFKNAYVRLAGADAALRNGAHADAEPVRGFGPLTNSIPIALEHATYKPHMRADWHGEIAAERNALLGAQ
jgi:hypothetical protein